MGQSTVPKAAFPVDGSGSSTFSNAKLLATIALLPLLLTSLLGLSYAWYPLFLLSLALPLFAAYNVLAAYLAANVLSNSAALPNNDITHYFTFTDPALKAIYTAKTKIPMETWFEAYFDQKLDINGDMLEILVKLKKLINFSKTKIINQN